MQCLYTCLDGFVLIIVLGMALPFEGSLPARLVCPQEYTAATVGPFFNPLMQNKMCM